jgi:nucleoside-diphosphate-sugar epimerase
VTGYDILITGVNGFIASHLAERLLQQEAGVRGTARRPAAAAWLAKRGVDILPADLFDREALSRAAAGCRSVVHVAAWTGGPELPPETGYQVNVDGTANVLAAAQAAGVERFIYISSVAVYGRNRAPLIDESAPTPRVGQAYPDSKIVAEALVRRSGLPFVVIRPASTYGPRGTAWTLGPMEKIKAGQLVLIGKDRGLVTPGYIDNVIDGLMLALRHNDALGEAFNLCDDQAVSYRQFYLAYARMLGLDALPMLPGIVAHLARLGPAQLMRQLTGRPPAGPWSLHFRFNPSQFSVAKAKRLLGYEPRIGFEEGMRRTEAWLRTSGNIP